MIQAHEQPIRLTIADMLDLCLFRRLHLDIDPGIPAPDMNKLHAAERLQTRFDLSSGKSAHEAKRGILMVKIGKHDRYIDAFTPGSLCSDTA